jgi:LysR family positive regulator for ilvC
MDQHELKLFLHLCTTLSFRRTSTECHISPSALSRTIQRIEEETGAQLFERDNRRVRMTAVGQRYREFAVEVLDRWEELKDTVTGESGELRGEISLYGSVTATYSLLPDIVNAFRQSYPRIHLRLRTGDAADALRTLLQDEVDIAVAAKPDSLDPALDFIKLIETPLVFVDLKRENDAPEPEDWSTVPMILSERGLARQRVGAWFRLHGVTPNIYAEVAGNEALLSMVRLGCGVGVVPRLVLENSPFRDYFAILEKAPALAPYSVGICVQKRRLRSPLVSAFWDTVKSVSG